MGAGQLTIDPLTTHVGAEVRGLRAEALLSSPDVAAELRDGLARYQVLFFPGLNPSPDEHIALARAFGDITQPSSVMPPVDGHPEILQIDSARGGGPGTSRWHVDITFVAHPPAGAVFHVINAPSVGGDTCFASAQAAFDTLHPSLQQLVLGYRAVHAPGAGLVAAGAANGGVVWEGERLDDIGVIEHPVVIRHPDTGRHGLFVNPEFTTHIVGLSPHESDAILRLLYDHIAREEHTVRYRWHAGSVAVWDNRAVWHRRVADTDGSEPRIIQRVQLRGAELAPALA